jgi:hypothetical protein
MGAPHIGDTIVTLFTGGHAQAINGSQSLEQKTSGCTQRHRHAMHPLAAEPRRSRRVTTARVTAG